MTTDLITEIAKAFGTDYESMAKDYRDRHYEVALKAYRERFPLTGVVAIVGYNPQLLLEDHRPKRYDLWGEDWSAEDFQKNLQKLLDDWHDAGKPWKTSSAQYLKEFMDDGFIDFHADRLSYQTLKAQNIEKRFVGIDLGSYTHHAMAMLKHETRGLCVVHDFALLYEQEFDTKPDVKQNGRSASYLKHDKTKRHRRTKR